MSLSLISFPACLYDSTLNTRKAAKQIARKAWRAGSWDEVWSDLEMVPFENVTGPIVACNDSGRFWRTEEPVWQLNWVAEAPFATPKELFTDWKKQLDLTLSAMQYLWFTIGMLTRGFTFQTFTYSEKTFRDDEPFFNEEGKRAVLLPWLAAYVNWLPELLALKDRLKRGVRGVGLVPYNCGEGLSILFLIAHRCRYIPDNVLANCRSLDDEGVVRTLLDYGVIKEGAGRFVVSGQ